MPVARIHRELDPVSRPERHAAVDGLSPSTIRIPATVGIDAPSCLLRWARREARSAVPLRHKSHQWPASGEVVFNRRRRVAEIDACLPEIAENLIRDCLNE